jgi:hypothetical protein
MKKYWWLGLILILSFWALAPLFHPGFFPMHDDEQIARLYELHQALSSGQFPPRWVGNLGFGYGYPLYNFYPPLVYYLGEIFYLLGFSLITSTKIVMGLGFVLSGVFIYFLAKEFFGKVGGLVAAVFYIYAPYHSLDLYVRGALAEFYAFVFLPAVFWSTRKLIKEKSLRWVMINSLFLSCLLLSHNFIALILMPFYFAFVAFLLLFEKAKKKVILLVSASFILFLGLTGYFWLPALAEKKETLVDTILTRELANYKLHFVYLRQLWQSPWGYGGSIYGLEDGLSFAVGKPHLILSFLAGILGIYLLWKRKRAGLLFAFCFLLFAFSLFMTSFHSQLIWDRLKPLWYLQFPWRFLIFAALFSSLLAGGMVSYLFNWLKKRQGWQWVAVMIPIAMTIFLSQGYFRPERYLEVNDSDYTSEQDLKWRVSGLSFEFVPKGVATKLSDIGTTQLDITQEEIATSSYQVLGGDLEVKEIKNFPHQKIFETKGEGELRVNVYYFPGWRAFIDKEEIKIKETGKLKLITLDLPAGEHQVEVVFANTPVRSLANIISLAAAAILLIGGLGVKKNFR